MDLDDTLDPCVATEMSTGANLLLHRISKGEAYAAMKVITQYLKETYSEAFQHIHVLGPNRPKPLKTAEYGLVTYTLP